MNKIGLFDSGVGGLTVAKELLKAFPSLDIRYFGDTARLPYGNKSSKTIITYSLEIAGFLLDRGIEMLVVACNTSSSIALEVLEKELPVPVVGMIIPGANAAVRKSASMRIGLIGTRATVASCSYDREIMKLNKDARVFSKACPLFVPLVEEGFADDPVTETVAKKYLTELLEKEIDTLILGCTHYPLLIPVIKKIAPGVATVSSGEATVEYLLEKYGFRKDEKEEKEGKLEIYVTDSGTHFKEVAEALLEKKITLEEVSLERLVSK
jgi:glutamate racemase